METLAGLRSAPRRVVLAQRRLWLIQTLAGPTLVLAGVAVLAAVMPWRRHTTSEGTHELPETPGAHRAAADNAAASHALGDHSRRLTD